MSGLEQSFYIISIIYMTIMLILVIALVVAVIHIRNKVVRIQHQIEEKIDYVTNVAERGGELAAAAVGGFSRKAKKAFSGKK